MATDLGKAYVQIVPSAKGIAGSVSKVLNPEADSAGKQAGERTGNSLVSTIKGVVIAAGIGKVISSALSEGGALEQSIGGVETLFKESADVVKNYAKDAYKTAGVSANEYMENVTSFSASLLQSMGGDTEKAAEKAHMAMVDMSDNANKMGTAMRDIQNAYQGFAKQNYTMLDNLKLGYGGTKTEMERLLADAQKLTGVKYNIDNLADVYEAIHVIQEEIGITGTTALEAESTLTGSFGAIKAAFKNLIGEIAIGGDIQSALTGLTSSLVTFIQSNLFPMLTNIVSQIVPAFVTILATSGPQLMQAGLDAIMNLATGLAEALPTLIPQAVAAIMTIVATLLENIPALIDAALQLMTGLGQGIIDALPVLIERIPEIITGIVNAIIESIPQIIDAGVQLLTALVEDLPIIINSIVAAIPKIIDGVVKAVLNGIPQLIQAGVKLLTSLITNLPTIILNIVKAIPEIIGGIVETLVNNIPLIVSTGVELLVSLVKNLPAIIAGIVKAIPEIIAGIVSAFGNLMWKIVEVGGSIVTGLWNGIKNAATWLWNKITGWLSDIWGGIKSFFGFGSPSKLFIWAGDMIDQGLAKGITDNVKPVTKAMDKLGEVATRSFESDVAFNAVTSANGSIDAGELASAGVAGAGRQPLSLILKMGGHEWRAFISDITQCQDQEVALKFAYQKS